ncbi:hypothetical protein IVA95_17105 [Bradyrhizobium sp. 157]|jgi:hypothetical protein|uniref:hypothetical protein n=1 Tax=Bradyrhizobium sp. 157 TaxID=2782631 RepID=UPI001FF78EC4|nr:hypothetical protein [Bradyrhizobium sp. 157]MCK1639278.1 hypothetical protein [Bradyrhizobium sp. 157]
MIKLDQRTAAKMGVALEEVCGGLPYGGDHETRKHIASQLVKAARRGNDTLEGLKSVAERALQELSSCKSA